MALNYRELCSPSKFYFAMSMFFLIAAAIQNMLLGAEALGIQALWSTGGMTHQPAMKPLLGLTEADEIVALLHFGYSDTPPAEGIRKIPLTEKISWKK